MCLDPGTMALLSSAAPYIAAGSQLASVFANNRAQSRQEEAVARAAQAETARQREYQAVAGEQLKRTREGFTVDQQKEDRTNLVSDLETRLAPKGMGDTNAASYAQLNPSTNTIVADSIASAMQRGAQAGQQTGKAAANLDSFGRQTFDNSVALGRTGEALNQTFNNMSGSRDAYNLELEAARNKGAGWRTAGDALGGIGSIASAYWLTGAGKTPTKRTTGLTVLPGGRA
jgi:hypothetical protein